MKQTFDTNNILYSLLNGNADLKSTITGSIYNGQRPLNSTVEDVVVNTIVLSQDYYPQIGTSNINVHVADLDVKINSVSQRLVNNTRLSLISGKVLEIIRSANPQGVSMTIENQTVIEETEINQHYVNIRITWSIHS